jgi:hypothetical protein
MTRPSRRVADYAPSTLNFSAELVLAAAVEEAVALLRERRNWPPRYIVIPDAPPPAPDLALDRLIWIPEPERDPVEDILLAAAQSADLILGRAR